MPTTTSPHLPDDSMPPTQLVSGAPPRKTGILVGLIVALVVVLLSTFVFLQQPVNPTIGVVPTATYALLPTGGPATLPPEVVNGWAVQDSTSFGVAFAPSSPKLGYTCGAKDNGSPSGFGFGITGDGGANWKMLPSPQDFPWCFIALSPTNLRAIALRAQNCTTCSGGKYESQQVFISMDGGANWSKDVASAGLPPSSTFVQSAGVWSGSDFYSLVALDRTHAVRVSHNGSAFHWLDLTGLFAAVPNTYQIGSLQTMGANLLATLIIPQCTTGQLPCTIIATSADHGVTWTKTPLTLAAPELNLLDAPAGAALLGVQFTADGTSPYLRSFDHGQTWLPLPKLPAGLMFQYFSQNSTMLEAPEGTLFATASASNTYGNTPLTIMRLNPGATVWEQVAQLPGQPGNVVLAAITSDAQGHPLDAWCVGTDGGIYERRIV